MACNSCNQYNLSSVIYLKQTYRKRRLILEKFFRDILSILIIYYHFQHSKVAETKMVFKINVTYCSRRFMIDSTDIMPKERPVTRDSGLTKQELGRIPKV